MDKEVLHTARRGQTVTENHVELRHKTRSLRIWRPSSLINVVNPKKNVLQKVPSVDTISTNSLQSVQSDQKKTNLKSSINLKNVIRREWDTVVSVVVVEATGLPDPVNDGGSHTLSCKFRLGSETVNTKSVTSTSHPKWRERLTLHLNKDHLLQVHLWDKGKQRNSLGSCVVDLSILEKERTHEIWKELDDGFGAIHLNITMCGRNNNTDDLQVNLEQVREKFAIYNWDDWRVVGQLHIKLLSAKGLNGKPNAYCTLEIDNERVQTNKARATAEPTWNKSYVFNVYDVTSTLDIKVYNSSIVNALTESLGKVSIPLLRVNNGEVRWYALKDKSKKSGAKGNCPRLLLEMTLIWNPVKAALRLFQPKEVKYIKKSRKFELGLVYNNVRFVNDIFKLLYELNEMYKSFLEWESREASSAGLVMWVTFWYHFQLWAAPLILLIPFIFFWIFHITSDTDMGKAIRAYGQILEDAERLESSKTDSVAGRIQEIPEMTLNITSTIEYIVSTVERIHNLLLFKVPFLSYLTMIFLVIVSAVLYYIPLNYLILGLGLYKYTRKCLNPSRIPNNDLLDFISRLPDNETLKEWKELSVPESSRPRTEPVEN